MRKKIDVDEALFSKNVMNKKIMNDIMYYLRKLVKLARRAQTMTLREGVDDSIESELNSLINEIDELEKSMK
jgi:hypothetical protein